MMLARILLCDLGGYRIVSYRAGINDEEDLPREFLTDLYEDIKKTEIKKDCDPYTS